MNLFRSLGRAMADLTLAVRNALYAAIDAWRDGLAELPEFEALTPEEYQAIGEMIDTLDLTDEEFNDLIASLKERHEFA